MIKRLLLSIIFLTLYTYAAETDKPETEPIKVMPLGDSITYGENISDMKKPRPKGKRTAYRSHLWYMLKDRNISVDFVGSRKAGQSIKPPFDTDNEGHPGWDTYDLSLRSYRIMAISDPDIVLLHIGTNDRHTNVKALTHILDDIDAYERDNAKPIRVLLAKVIDNKSHNKIIATYNQNLEKLAKKRINNGDLITLIDMYHQAGLHSSDYADNLHPNTNGYKKIAKIWLNALRTPYSLSLHTFPRNLVNHSYIKSVHVNDNTHQVTMITKVPDTGITF